MRLDGYLPQEREHENTRSEQLKLLFQITEPFVEKAQGVTQSADVVGIELCEQIVHRYAGPE